MPKQRRTEEVIPSARRLITSLRDLGYDFSSAVADLVDNSIEAEASYVRIDIKFDGVNSWVRVADDGFGMDAEALTSAMRYGTEREYTEEDLGKFGLGLKTASMSQCRRLTVASRSNKDRARIVARSWDLEYIEKTDAWELIHLSKDECPPQLIQPISNRPGTVVLWERLDRILGYKVPDGEAARKRLAAMTREVEDHLAMVFHRFLSGDVKYRELNIYMNGNKVSPWDPYAREETATRTLRQTKIPVAQEGVKGRITLQPYVLPHQSKFSSTKAFEKAAGPDKWNRQQGFYIYRADRMIQSGGWSGLRTMDEHTKLARIALSFSPKLDAAFKINVAKMRVQLPAEIRMALTDAVKPVLKAAQVEYREGGKKPGLLAGAGVTTPTVAPKSGKGSHGIVASTADNPGGVDPYVVAGNGAGATWTLDEVRAKLMAEADDEEKKTINRLFRRLRQTLNAQKTAR